MIQNGGEKTMLNEKKYLDYLYARKYVESEISKINSIYQTDIYSDKIILPFSIWKFDKKLSNIMTNTYALIGPNTTEIFTEIYGKDILNICKYGFLMKKSLRHMVKSNAYVKNGDVKEPFYVYAIRTLGEDFKPFLDLITEDRCKYVDSEGNILAQIMLKSDVSQNSICLDAIKKYDVWQEKKLYGKVSMGVVRSSYVIDENGIIIDAQTKVKPETNAEQVLCKL